MRNCTFHLQSQYVDDRSVLIKWAFCSQGNGEGQLQEVSRPPRIQHQRGALRHHILPDEHLQEAGKMARRCHFKPELLHMEKSKPVLISWISSVMPARNLSLKGNMDTRHSLRSPFARERKQTARSRFRVQKWSWRANLKASKGLRREEKGDSRGEQSK